MSLTIIEATSKPVLDMYGAFIHGTDKYGIMDIEFPNMHSAASWYESAAKEFQVVIRDSKTRFDTPVVISVKVRL